MQPQQEIFLLSYFGLNDGNISMIGVMSWTRSAMRVADGGPTDNSTDLNFLSLSLSLLFFFILSVVGLDY